MSRISYYKPEFWINKGLSEIEATSKISEIKEKQKLNRKPRLTILQKQFWINKGLSEIEATSKISSLQKSNSSKVNFLNRFNPRSKESWMSKGLTEIESIQKLKEIFNSGSQFRKEYWIKRGLSELEATSNISKIQHNNSIKRKEYKKEDQNTNIEYYIKRNYPNAIEYYKDRQNTRCLQKYVEKYGEIEGIKKYNLSISKFINTAWYSKTKEEQINLTLKRTKFLNFYSNSSIIFFEKIIKDVNINYNIRWKKNEHFIKYDNGIVFYDFCIPELKLIIEYHGIKFHPNKNKLSISQFNEWTQLLSKKPANEIFKNDEFKKELAIKHGYDIFIVWENDNMESKIIELKNEIMQRINSKTN